MGALFMAADDEENACEVQINPRQKIAQFGKGKIRSFSATEKSLREGGAPNSARNYAIKNLTDTDKPFTVRIAVKYDSKFGGSLIDTEIAGQRTMISFRPGLKVERLLLRSEEIGIKNVKIAGL
jgi:beta-fructofuranosidase